MALMKLGLRVSLPAYFLSFLGRSKNGTEPGTHNKARPYLSTVARSSRVFRGAFLFLVIPVAASGVSATADRRDLRIFSDTHPVSLFFRDTEATAASGRLSYEDWNARYSRLAGVIGKMLDEEVLGRSAAQPYYRRFKAEHPEQAVLLHANGTFRKPQADNRAYHDGHWLYYNGASVLDRVVPEQTEITLRVSDVSLFSLMPYRVLGGKPNTEVFEDVGLCALAADGKPDWSRAEQAMLIAVDAAQGTITIRRGLYGSTPKEFAAGQAYVAAHVAQSWGTSNKLWQFNMATTCPRDHAGRDAAEVWVAELAAAMGPGGAIEFVDGVEFDVPFREPVAIGRNRRADCDADGHSDGGVIDGQPVFAVGVDGFFRKLRAALPHKLILADVGDKEQRSMDSLNGVETEGWPHLHDPEFELWSTALNDHRFWEKQARSPVFTYGLMKFLGQSVITFAQVRLTLAGPVLVDAAVPMGHNPPEGSNGVWDELMGGALGKPEWLGRALGPTRWLALETANLLERTDWTKTISSTNARWSALEGGIEALARLPGAEQFSLRIGGLNLLKASDVVVAIKARAKARFGYPADSYRTLSLAVMPAGASLDAKFEYPTSPVAEEAFEGRYYLRGVAAGECDVVLTIEGAASVTIEAISAHAAPDLAVREFEHGAILANPSHEPQVFNLDRLFPGKSFRRIQATVNQDTETNDGKPVAGTLTLLAKDALFLSKN